MRLRYTLPALADLASILDYVVDPYPNSRCHRSVLRYPLAGAVTDDPHGSAHDDEAISISHLLWGKLETDSWLAQSGNPE
jgi:hypothetical protein